LYWDWARPVMVTIDRLCSAQPYHYYTKGGQEDSWETGCGESHEMAPNMAVWHSNLFFYIISPLFFWVTGGRSPTSWPHIQHSGNPSTTRGRRQCLTGRIRHTPLIQQVPSARTKIAWEWNPYTASVMHLEGLWLVCDGDQGCRGLRWLINCCWREWGTEDRSILNMCIEDT